MVDRTNIDDAKKVFNRLLGDNSNPFAKFLAEEITYMHNLNPSNWNLNLDVNGRLIVSNAGQEYCTQVYRDTLTVLCDRDILKKSLPHTNIDITFVGLLDWAKDREKIRSKNIDEVPDGLKNVKNSVRCDFSIHSISSELFELVRPSHFAFIDKAMKTKLLSQSKTAHSTGAIGYLSEVVGKSIPNPDYISSPLRLEKVMEQFQKNVTRYSSLTKMRRQQRLLESDPKPQKLEVYSIKSILSSTVPLRTRLRASCS